METKKVLSALLIVGLLSVGASVPAQEKLRIPVASPASITSIVESVAVYRGWFKEIGYDATIYSVSGGESAAVLALEKGDLPFFNTDDNIPEAIKPGSDIRLVASTLNKLPYYLIAGAKVRSYADLPKDGVIVGISSPTSANVFVSLALLEKHGIKNPRIVKVGGSVARLASVKAGKVHVGALDLGNMLIAKEQGLNVLGSSSEVFQEFLMMQIAMNRKWVERNPQKAVEIVGTLIRGCDYINRNREGTIEVLAKFMKNKPEVAQQVYDIGVAQEKSVPRHCEYTEKGVQEYIKSAQWSQAIDPNMKVPRTRDFSMPDLYQKGLDWFKKKYGG